MRAVSSKATILVESLKPYQKLMRLASQTLRVLHATHASRFISPSHLYATLSDQKCSACGSYGHYLFIFTGDRCCFWCLYSDARFSIMTLASAASEFKVSKDSLRTSCHVLYSIPGEYQLPSHGYHSIFPDTIGPKRTELVSTIEALHFCSTLDSSGKPVQRSSRALTRTLLPPLSPVSIMDKSIPPYRGMAACSFPYLNPRTEQSERVVWCIGCVRALNNLYGGGLQEPDARATYVEARRKAETAFMEEAFLAHFYECRNAQKVWNYVVDHFRRGRQGWPVDDDWKERAIPF
jgi:hypothetical protein